MAAGLTCDEAAASVSTHWMISEHRGSEYKYFNLFYEEETDGQDAEEDGRIIHVTKNPFQEPHAPENKIPSKHHHC